ncbi:MAG TPA: A/G-specific adenine glycosylase [Gammaproteobacteria bacterium]|nr:A/G-specific adenine glycosylase [Gammaproteobacteria bacterium]HRA43016.1 A/G-specific adenine glycosylase [Gammaproteobacteria bacterium]
MILSQKILTWFDKHGRHDLPWQKNPTPYRVWISEIMLQQTQVTTVIDYFERFMKRFPTLSKLAHAPLDDVFELWSGLGYYARAKNLHKTAQIINTTHKGKFPTDYDAVLALPGIGRSTAGAILSISTQQCYPILDGNVKRVLARHFAVDGWNGNPITLEKLWQHSEKITPKNRVKDYTQAIMDLGATVCTRSRPKCTACPIARSCAAKKLDRVKFYPMPKPRAKIPTKATGVLMLVSHKHKCILLEKRPIKGIWGGLWSLPECPLQTDTKDWCTKTFKLTLRTTHEWEPFRHTFTHFHLNIHPIFCEVRDQRKPKSIGLNYQWYSFEKTDTLGLPAPIRRLIDKLKSLNQPTSMLSNTINIIEEVS